MLSASALGGADLAVDYSGDVTAAEFDLADFTTTPSSFLTVAIAQAGATGLTLTMESDPSAELTLQYSGDAPGVQTPDEVTIS